MSEDNVPFDVVDEVQVGDLTEVRQEMLPITQNLKVRIDGASVKTSESKDLKSLALELAIVDGIEVDGEVKFINKKVFTGFMDLCVWANPETKNSNWYKTKQYLLGFKQLCQALELDITNVKVNDEFCTSLLGRELLINIVHEEETVADPNELDAKGKPKRKKTGTLRERVKAFKKVVA